MIGDSYVGEGQIIKSNVKNVFREAKPSEELTATYTSWWVPLYYKRTHPVCSHSRHLDSRFRILGQGSLQVDDVKHEDIGTYTCRAANLDESTDAEASLVVHGQ